MKFNDIFNEMKELSGINEDIFRSADEKEQDRRRKELLDNWDELASLGDKLEDINAHLLDFPYWADIIEDAFEYTHASDFDELAEEYPEEAERLIKIGLKIINKNIK